ncbi:MAG: beta-N-acetylhexosaminidase [bacterium]
MKVGRLLMIGFDGTELPAEFRSAIQKHGIGGFVLFERNLKNPAQIIALNKHLYSLDRDFVPLIAVDQEGGRVQRLKPPFFHLPSPRKVEEYYKEHNSIDIIYEYGNFIAEELSVAGFNMNLAPVLDLSEKKDGVIGDRAFSNIPLIVEEIGVSMIAGMQDRGIIACAKHFPGNTDTEIDPHEDLPVVEIKSEVLYRNLSPFIHAINNDVGSVMVSHTLFKGIDNVPASMSKKIVNGILKTETRFKGIVITDDVKMGAIARRYSVTEAVINALSANVDMVMVGNLDVDEFEDIIDKIEESVAEGVIKKEQINASLLRTELVKNAVGIRKQLVYDEEDILKLLNDKNHISFIRKFFNK